MMLALLEEVRIVSTMVQMLWWLEVVSMVALTWETSASIDRPHHQRGEAWKPCPPCPFWWWYVRVGGHGIKRSRCKASFHRRFNLSFHTRIWTRIIRCVLQLLPWLLHRLALRDEVGVRTLLLQRRPILLALYRYDIEWCVHGHKKILGICLTLYLLQQKVNTRWCQKINLRPLLVSCLQKWESNGSLRKNSLLSSFNSLGTFIDEAL